MKGLKRNLESLLKGLTVVTERSEKMLARVEKLAEKGAKEKPKAKIKAPKKAAGRKATKPTATEKIFEIIAKSEKGVDTALLKKKAGFTEIKIRNVIFRLKKQGKIKSGSRGVYVKV
jgi:hypothetical protein